MSEGENILSMGFFIAMYLDNLADLPPARGNYKRAYYKTETEFREKYKIVRFSSYESFKSARSRYYRNLRNNTG